ncbi:MAG: hypothetical protein OXG56_01360 [Gammaproteobacteria bacterium]|nr:hypothetical protein [Gammaproteobacteria bacterium]
MEIMAGVDREELERRVRENEEYLKDLKSRGGTTDLGVGETLLFIATVAVACFIALLWR